MKDIIQLEKILTRRFDEIFFIDIENISETEFNYFVGRIADFYQFTLSKHPEFIHSFDQQLIAIDEQLKETFKSFDVYFKKLTGVTKQLEKNSEFMTLIKKGKDDYERMVGAGAHSVGTEEALYQSFEWRIRPILNSKIKQKVSLDDANSIFFDFSRICYTLKDLGKGDWITKIDDQINQNEEMMNECNNAKNIVERIHDYTRISSYRKIEDIWNHIYNKNKDYGTGFEIYLVKSALKRMSNDYPVKRTCNEYKIHVKRFFNSILDWIEEQNFVEESLLDFKIWSEYVFNRDLVEIYNNTKTHKEKRFKDEFAKYLFNSYKILSIKEPSLDLGRADSLILSRDKKIITEVKIIQKNVSSANILKLIEGGLTQIKSYSKISGYIDALTLLIFNFSEKDIISNSIFVSRIINKPLYILFLNLKSSPSSSKSITILNKKIDSIINKYTE